MKHIGLLLALVTSLQAGAQIKNTQQLAALRNLTTTELAKKLGPYWRQESQGKLDTNSYVRWIPANITADNNGQMVMCFYKVKGAPVDYVVFQTLDKAYRKQALAELKKEGYQLVVTEHLKDGNKDYYSNGMTDISIFDARPDPEKPEMYIFGVNAVVKGSTAPPHKK